MFISFGVLSKKMLIPLLIPIIYFFRHYILEKVSDNEDMKKSVFINTFIVSLSYSLNAIPLLIEYKLIKSKRNSLKSKEFENQLIIEKKK